VRDPAALGHQVQLLMRGAFVAAVEGRAEAARHARVAAERLLERDREDERARPPSRALRS
jgi:hypothetical protein